MTERCNERFFDMPVGLYCGVLIREAAAKKLQKILWRQTQEIKDTPEQTTVHYYDGQSREELKNRIALLNKADRLTFVPDVFRTDAASLEAMNEVKQFYTEHYGETEGGDAT